MQARNSPKINFPPDASIREQLAREIEQTPDRLLPFLLEFVRFLSSRWSRTSLGEPQPPSTGTSLLAALENIGPWEGDDFEQCLELVHRARSAVPMSDGQREDEAPEAG